ncbi:MAG: hypothetical protein H7256_03340 [Bdellovibrio sp.]|nr:hypothetical protein [Bdellovibrio sp.]
MKIIFAVLFLLVSQVTYASNFDGVWKGVGQMNSSVEGKLAVDPVIFEFSQINDVISSKDCWNFKFGGNDWRYCGHRDLQLKGNQLFYKGAAIGTYSENKIVVSYLEGTAQVDAEAEIQTDGKMNYHYQSIEASGKFLIQDGVGLVR